tara:strand:+ start:222 stop:1289 length:1068 start_codon:yes stop_codon:yes gene_type:complete
MDITQSRSLPKTAKDGSKIYFGHPQYVKLSQIKIHKLNRRKVSSHALDMVDKLKDFGMIDTIKIFQSDVNGTFLTAEGAHRIMALQMLFEEKEWNDINVPVLILPDIYKPDDEDRVLEVIISFNHGNKPWTIRDHIQGWSRSSQKKVYQEMARLIDKYDNARKNKQYSVTDSQLASLYTGLASQYKDLKAGLFTLKDYKKPYVDNLMEAIIDWKKRFGEDKKMGFFPTVCQNTIVFTHQYAIDSALNRIFPSNEARMEWFDSWLEFYQQKLYSLFENEKSKAPNLRSNPLEVDKADEQSAYIVRLEQYMEQKNVVHLLDLPLKGNPCKYTTYKQKSVDGKKYLENHSNGVAEYQQ